jgi:hypothetical protein
MESPAHIDRNTQESIGKFHIATWGCPRLHFGSTMQRRDNYKLKGDVQSMKE